MRKFVSAVLALIILLSLSIWGASALEAEGFTYIIDDGKAVITGYRGSETNLVIPSTLKGLKVEEIEDNAFYQNHSITSVTIENGVEEIGDKAFYNCTGLTKVTLPDSLTDIGDSAFSYCVYLTDVTLGKGIDEISNNCFSHDTRLESIVIPEGVVELEDGAFEECTHLKSVTLPKSLKEIGKYSFAYTFNLSTVTLPDNLTNIGEGAFYFNSALEEVTIPASVKTLGNYAFYSNTSLNAVNLNEGLVTLGDMVFDGTTLKSLYIPSTLTTAGSYPFGYTYDEETFEYNITPDFMALCTEGSYGAQLCQGHGIAYTIVPVKNTAETAETSEKSTTESILTTEAKTSATTESYEKGDVNLDLNVDKIDTDDIQSYIAYLKELSEKSLKLADFDENGKVNIKDSTKIKMAIV